jgi:TonB family protein
MGSHHLVRVGAIAIAFAVLLGDHGARADGASGPYDYDESEAIAYLDAMHSRIHPRWLMEMHQMDKALPSAPWNDVSAYAIVYLTVDAKGKLVDINMIKGTGVPELNALIREALSGASPFPRPPAGILSSDQKARIRWQIHRDPHKHCAPKLAWPILVEPG